MSTNLYLFSQSEFLICTFLHVLRARIECPICLSVGSAIKLPIIKQPNVVLAVFWCGLVRTGVWLAPRQLQNNSRASDGMFCFIFVTRITRLVSAAEILNIFYVVVSSYYWSLPLQHQRVRKIWSSTDLPFVAAACIFVKRHPSCSTPKPTLASFSAAWIALSTDVCHVGAWAMICCNRSTTGRGDLSVADFSTVLYLSFGHSSSSAVVWHRRTIDAAADVPRPKNDNPRFVWRFAHFILYGSSGLHVLFISRAIYMYFF